MMTEKEREEYRKFLSKEYFLKTGINMVCVERDEKHEAQYKTSCAENIVQVACDYWGITVEQLIEKTRKTNIVSKRRMLIAIMREYLITHETIGEMLDKDHTTAIYSMEKHNNLLQTSEEYRSAWIAFKDYCVSKVIKIFHDKEVQQATGNRYME